jgi:hypothetical protein
MGGQQWGNRIHEGGPFGVLSLPPYAAAFAVLLFLGYLLREQPVKPAPPPEGKPA